MAVLLPTRLRYWPTLRSTDPATGRSRSKYDCRIVDFAGHARSASSSFLPFWSEHSPIDLVDVPEIIFGVETVFNLSRRQMLCDEGIFAHQAQQIPVAAPRCHRVSLHRFVRFLPLGTLFDECKQKPLGVDQPTGQSEIPPHVLGIDHEVPDDISNSREHVIDEDCAVGQDDAFNRRMADVALMP